MYWKEIDIRQLHAEIRWLKNQMNTKKLSVKHYREYEHQIRQKELDINLGIWQENP